MLTTFSKCQESASFAGESFVFLGWLSRREENTASGLLHLCDLGREEEIARLHIDQWNASEKIIDWSKTKNGNPHAIPVPTLAAELIESIAPNEYGWYFPSATDASRPVSAGTLYSFMWRQRQRDVIPLVTNRDLRRTWKTLAGKAGVSKEIRDRIQNHALQDVSSKSYDRWSYMPEKRAGMDKWNDFIEQLLSRPAVAVAA
jgi:integrase